jgi:uncharacterized membrane protein
MYSKTTIAGHPIHPMLVAFPIAFYTATLIAYIAYAAGVHDVFWFRLGYVANVAGVLTGVIAAIPGSIDWNYGIPAESPAKRTGLIHMIANVSALVFFILSLWVNSDRYSLLAPDATAGIVLSLLGVVATLVAGAMGWTLTGTHHVGVDLTPEQERIDPANAYREGADVRRLRGDGEDSPSRTRSA